MKRRLLLVLALVVAGREALAEGDRAAADGRLDDAIAAWERSARWYLPFAPHVDDAYARLVETAGKGRPYALPAWRAVRSSALATRTLWTPHADELAEANAQIAELSSREPAGAASGGPDAATRKTFHVERLAHDPRPQPIAAWFMLLVVGAVLAGITYLVRRIGKPRHPTRS